MDQKINLKISGGSVSSKKNCWMQKNKKHLAHNVLKPWWVTLENRFFTYFKFNTTKKNFKVINKTRLVSFFVQWKLLPPGTATRSHEHKSRFVAAL